MKKPNVILIMSDDQGYWSLGCAGNKEIITPNIDALANRGIRFDDCFCVSPVCSPARASVFTGTIPSAHGVQDWLRGGNLTMKDYPQLKDNKIFASENVAIDYLDNMTTYTDILAKNGYSCALSGKWHMGNSAKPQHGFTKWFTIARGGCNYFHPDLVRDGKVYFDDRYVTNLITEDAINNLNQLASEENPFYISVHYTAPHDPWDAKNHPQEFLDLYKDCPFDSVPIEPLHPWLAKNAPYKAGESGRRENLTGYYAAITAMDAGIGKLLCRLDELGLTEDTIVMFTSDNGFNMGHHGIWGKGNGTFPQNMYDSSVKVPLIISMPKSIPSGVVNADLVSHYDIFKTLMDYLAIDYETKQPLPGKSLAPILKGEKLNQKEAVVVFDEYGPTRMIRTSEWKYICRLPMGPDELYHLEADPNERNNLIDDEVSQPIKKQLRAELAEWFYRYTNPAIDASHEFNTGMGQLCQAGIYSNGEQVFAPLE